MARLSPSVTVASSGVYGNVGGVVVGGDWLLRSRPDLLDRWGSHRLASYLLHRAEIGLTILLGFLVTLALAGLWQENEILTHRQIFSQVATERAVSFANKLVTIRDKGLTNLTRLMEVDEDINLAKFMRFTRPMSQEESVQAWEWIPEVAAAAQEKFLQSVQAEGFTNFQIFEQDRQGKKVPVTGRDKYYPILYVEPLAGNEKAVGYDVNSNPIARQALQEALQTGQMTATDPLTLIQEPEQQQAIVVYSPVLKTPHAPPVGVTALVLRLEQFLTETFTQASYGDRAVHLEWLEVYDRRSPRTLAASSPRDFPIHFGERGMLLPSEPLNFGERGKLLAREPVTNIYPIFIFGKAYTLLLWPGQAFEEANPLEAGMMTMAVGLGATAMLTVCVAMVTNRQAHLKQQVQKQTATLQETLSQLQERVKEMNCVVTITQLSQQPDLSLEDFLQGCVDCLPPAFQYPALISAQLTLGESSYQTANYQPSPWYLQTEFAGEYAEQGSITVYYRENRPFLGEEQLLLQTIGQFLSRFLESHYAEMALTRSERNYREIFNSTQEAILIHQAQTGEILDVNEPLLHMHGYENKSEIVGQSVAVLGSQPAEITIAEVVTYSHQAQAVGPQMFEWLAKRKDGTPFWIEVSLRAIEMDGRNCILAVGRDISERKRQEQKIRYLTRLYATLSQVNQAIIQNRDRDDLFRAICDVGIRVGQFLLIWFGLINPETQAIEPYIYAGQTTDYLDDIYITVRDEPAGRGPTGTAAREQRLVICEDILHDPLMAPWRAKATGFGYYSSAAVPLKQGQQVIGVLTIYSEDVGFFTEDEQYLLQEIGDNISFALDAIQSDLAHQQAEQKLQENEERLRLALESANQGLYDLNVQTGEAIISPQYAQMLGYDPATFRETNARWLERLHPDDQDIVAANYTDYLQGNVPHYQVEFRQRMATGEWKWILSMGKIVEWDTEGKPLRMLGIHTDITERKQAEDQIQNLAYYDPLTGLPNRRLLLDRTEQTLFLAQRKNHYGAIIFIDLDRFKTLNDARGHDQGDRLLQAVAERLQSCLRETDTVARLGGDEFIVLLPELSREEAQAARFSLNVGEKIRQSLAKLFTLEAEDIQISASLGITVFPKANETASDLFKEADTAMYQAKASGRNKVCLFESTMQIEVESRFALEAELRQAFEQQQFQIYLQPQVNEEGHWIGAEALLRWQHPTQGWIPPYVFIPIAEETGLICQMGEWVLQEVCHYLSDLQERQSPLHIAVNVSPRQFRQTSFIAQVKSILAATGVDPYRLTLELTEGLIIEDSHQAIATMAELQALGIHFSIDDFGTGYSSLSYLKRLPLNELKIDRSFVQDAPNDFNNAALVEAIISVARNFNLAIVAEGVETPAQAEFLRVRGCHLYQGYLFARPMPMAEFDQQLQLG